MRAVTSDLRTTLVATALAWESSYGVAPSITSAISEFDAARAVGMHEPEYVAARVKVWVPYSKRRFKGPKFEQMIAEPGERTVFDQRT